MVTTVSRALASLSVVALLLMGAPLSQGASALPAQTARHAPLAVAAASHDDRRGSHGGSGRDLLVERDSGAVAVALPGWSVDHRPPVRDLAEVYSPVLPWLGDLGVRVLVPLPESVGVPHLDDAFALPFGRAPPLSRGM
ncbi:hypothetical protein [Streptomonospora salina]|uniref:Uncharacterized protein n=1 Tax=Streptomonospora salina TaxID=104205 RepID=A0A841EEC5_9ACTN|nr:hypothetical protein [Streptomonospora salina]MBB5997781.1 hypothetical protein [Streptomonospora salina]